jgi:Mn2+/Fe2+ NRAMP family transporter
LIVIAEFISQAIRLMYTNLPISLNRKCELHVFLRLLSLSVIAFYAIPTPILNSSTYMILVHCIFHQIPLLFLVSIKSHYSNYKAFTIVYCTIFSYYSLFSFFKNPMSDSNFFTFSSNIFTYFSSALTLEGECSSLL